MKTNLKFAAFLSILAAAQAVPADTLYVTADNGTVTQVTADGTQSIYAGGNGGLQAIAFDSAGNLFVVDQNNNRLKKYTAGVGSIFATNLNNPIGLAIDSWNNVCVNNYNDDSILKFAPDGTSMVLGHGDGNLQGMAFDTSDNLYVSEFDANRIAKLDPNGNLTIFAGANLLQPTGLAFDSAGNLYVANYGDGTIRKFSAGGTDLGVLATLDQPIGLAFDSAGNLFVAQADNRIFKVTPAAVASELVTIDNGHIGYLAAWPGLKPMDPRTSSWATANAGKYARVYTNDAMKTAGNTLTNWAVSTMVQTNPAYCGIQEVYSSTDWVYVRSTGLAAYVMGPWYLNSQRTTMFPNLPTNQKLLYRFPRTNGVPATKSLTGGGQIGIFVDGVEMFNSWDAYSWSTVSNTDAQNITGYWNRDAYINEGVSFDPANAHQQNGGTYHYHANPIGLRYQLGDHVDFNSSTKIYTESTNTPTKHSPILAWTSDGYPVYGPYGYSNATNAASAIRRMVSGYSLRNGQNGSQNLTTLGRIDLPQWAVRIFNVNSNQTGPNVNGQYPLGRYMEDNDYLGDLGKTLGVDFDLDEYNGRFCVTPEFPGGTYAYFVAITSGGAPAFPYNIGRAFRGSPVGGSVTTIAEPVVTNFLGNTNLTSTVNAAAKIGTVTLTWNSVEGGSYQVETSANPASGWSVATANLRPQPNQTSITYTNITSATNRFYRVGRASVATFDSAGTTVFATNSVAPGGNAYRGQTVILTITLPASPPNPPAGAPITSVTIGTIGTITASSATCTAQGTVQAVFTIPSNYTPTGSQNVNVQFNPNPPYTLTGGFTIN